MCTFLADAAPIPVYLSLLPLCPFLFYHEIYLVPIVKIMCYYDSLMFNSIILGCWFVSVCLFFCCFFFKTKKNYIQNKKTPKLFKKFMIINLRSHWVTATAIAISLEIGTMVFHLFLSQLYFRHTLSSTVNLSLVISSWCEDFATSSWRHSCSTCWLNSDIFPTTNITLFNKRPFLLMVPVFLTDKFPYFSNFFFLVLYFI